MTLEEMQKEINRIKEENQNNYIDKLYEMVENLCVKANEKSYTPTNYEREVFNKIRTLLNDMNNWF